MPKDALNGLVKIGACAATLLLGAGYLALANAETVQLRGAHIYPAHYVQSGVTFEEWASRLRERSNGEITVEIVHDGALLAQTDHVDGIEAGLVDVVTFWPIFFPGEFRVEGALTNIVNIWSEPPPTVAGTALIHERLHSEFPEFEEEYERRNMAMLFPLPVDPYIIACTEEASTLDDLAGRRMRTFGAYFPILQEHLGVEPVTVPAAEAYSALATGLVDCVYTTPDWIHANSLYEVAPHLFIPAPDQARPLLFATAVVAINRDTYEQLSEEHREIIDEVSAEMVPVVGEMMEGVYEQGIQNLLDDGGGTINYMSVEDFEAWRERTPNLLDRAAEDLDAAGLPGTEIVARYRELAEAHVTGNWPTE